MPYKDKLVAAAARKNKAVIEKARLRGIAEKQGITLHEWRKTNQPTYYGLHRLIANNKRKALKRNRVFELKAADLRKILVEQKGLCPISGLKLRLGAKYDYRNASLDRIVAPLGYIVGNVRLVCWWVNLARHSMDDETFIKWCGVVHKNQKRKNKK